MLLSCYQQPAIPRDKPLACTGNEDDPDDCPAGFRCVGGRVCANLSCERDEECPVGLVCSERTGCDLPAADGGAGDARDGGDGGVVIGEPVFDARGADPGDGPVVTDVPSAFDAPGGS
jgi:hypothetical protein